MAYFEFSTNVISTVLSELEKAQKFIKVGVFQIHDQKLFDLLTRKAAQGIHVELFTLPNDSIDDQIIRLEVAEWTESLIETGAKVFVCRWNVGDPEGTRTAVGRWYSYHGKFIVTDKTAIALSANFTRTNELDAVMMLDDDSKIREFAKKFDTLVELFVTEHLGSGGTIKEKILNTQLPEIEDVFLLPRTVSDIHEKYWVSDYPASLCADDTNQNNHLYITPFDVKARSILKRLINEANSFLYMSTESFTDEPFSNLLVQAAYRKLDIRLITGYKSRDFTDRMQNMLRELLASGVKVYTTDSNLHAKLIVTENIAAVTSINLNRMNLGFTKNSSYWRGNTETIYITDDNQLISKAKKDFETILNANCYDISTKIIQKLEKQVKGIFTTVYGLSTAQEVKTLFSKLILDGQINERKGVQYIARVTSLITKRRNKKTIKKDDFLRALILFFLSERQHDVLQLRKRIEPISSDAYLEQLLSDLLDFEYIEEENGLYKINIETLIRQ